MFFRLKQTIRTWVLKQIMKKIRVYIWTHNDVVTLVTSNVPMEVFVQDALARDFGLEMPKEGITLPCWLAVG